MIPFWKIACKTVDSHMFAKSSSLTFLDIIYKIGSSLLRRLNVYRSWFERYTVPPMFYCLYLNVFGTRVRSNKPAGL